MKSHHIQIYKAYFNNIAEILTKEYEQTKKPTTNEMIQCVVQMHLYTNTLLIDYNMLQQEHRSTIKEYEKIIDNLKSKLNEANNIVKLGNLGSSRFGKQNEKR